MGLWTFAKQALGALDINISHSPILDGLGSLADMVSHAIPVVGPIIDAAVPALQAVFSNDATSKDFLMEPIMTNLNQSAKDIKTILTGIDDIKTKMDSGFQNLTDQTKQLSKDLQDKLNTENATACLAGVQDCIGWLSKKQDTLAKITANSGDDAFGNVLDSDGGALALGGYRQKLSVTLGRATAFLNAFPAQQMLDLYLLGVYWLLLYDKAHIIILGLQARGKFALGKYREYIGLLGKISASVLDLQQDTVSAIEFLKKFRESVRDDRQNSISIGVDPAKKVMFLDDKWSSIAVGAVPYAAMLAALGDDLVLTDAYTGENMVNDDKLRFWKKTGPRFFKEAASRAVDGYLEPAEHVILDLTESIREWNSRLPLTPTSDVKPGEQPKPYVKCSKISIKPADVEEKGYVVAMASPKVKKSKADWLGQDVSFAVTYINGYGESSISDWGDSLSLPDKYSEDDGVELHLASAQYKNNPSEAGNGPVRVGGKIVPPTKGIRRCVYMRYSPEQTDIYRRIGEVGEGQDLLLWRFD